MKKVFVGGLILLSMLLVCVCGYAAGEIRCSVSGGDRIFTVEVKTFGGDIEKIEYADCSEFYSIDMAADELFELGIDKTAVQNGKLYAEANKAYAVRAIFTDGTAAYDAFLTPICIVPSPDFYVSVTGTNGNISIVSDDKLVDMLIAEAGDTVTLRRELDAPGCWNKISIEPEIEIIWGEEIYYNDHIHEGGYQIGTFTMPMSDVTITTKSVIVYPHIYEAYTEKGNTIANLMCIWSGVIIGVKYDEKGALVEMKTVELPHMGPSYETVTIENFEADKVFAWDSIKGMNPIGDAVKVEKNN